MDAQGITPTYNMNPNDGMGMNGGGFWWFFIVLFLIFGWGGNGFGFGNNAGGVDTYGIASNAVNEEFIKRDLWGTNQNVSDQGFAVQKEILENRFTNQIGLQGVTGAVTENRFANQLGQQNLQAQIADCCCQTKNAIHEEGEATRALINAQAMQDLRDRLADRDRDLMTANFQISQQAQNTTLINALRPTPQPAYITCSPYFAYNPSCGCGGCGGNQY